MLEIRNVVLPLDGQLKTAAAKKLGAAAEDIADIRLIKRSVDARKRADVHFLVTCAVSLRSGEADALRRGGADVFENSPEPEPEPVRLGFAPEKRPVVCGAGPAGLFAALTLAEAGARPIVIERGGDADSRAEAVRRFHETRALDPDCGVQFGEGGAGTFSDGKLNTGTHDARCARVLRVFSECGAPEEILWQAKPHIGTDLLPGVVKNLRKRIVSLGGEVLFNTRLTGITVRNGAVAAAETTRGDIETDRLILAAGHSARDVFELLRALGAPMERKAFSMGVRVEHPRELIDRAQYGAFAGHPALGAADYKLSCHLPDGRSAYTFCMCPGGSVVAAASEPGMLVTNGMSPFARDGRNSNSAFLAGVSPADFGGESPLAGVELQRFWESRAFELGGGDYTAPAQTMGEFLTGTPVRAHTEPTYPLGVRYCDISECLPPFVTRTLRLAAPVFGQKLRGFDSPEAVLTAIESRSSSPVRVLRGDGLESAIRGLYPCGEGAGYAGGIMSAAVDGIRISEAVAAAMIDNK